jgi:hypothetical protein
MNIETGEIIYGENNKMLELFLKDQKNVVSIAESDMTKKQKINKKVSLKDHKSKLGKKLTEKRKEKRLTKKQKKNKRRNVRNKIKKL